MRSSLSRLAVAGTFRALLLGALAGIATLIAPAIVVPAFITAGSLWGASLIYSVVRAETEQVDSEGVSTREGYKMGPLAKLENGIIDLIVEHDASYFRRSTSSKQTVEKADEALQNELKEPKKPVTPVEVVPTDSVPTSTPQDETDLHR